MAGGAKYHTNERTPGTGTVDWGTQTTSHNWVPGPEYFGGNGAGHPPSGPRQPPVSLPDAGGAQYGGEPAQDRAGNPLGRP